jgi:phosphoenolpyruvate carboxylase
MRMKTVARAKNAVLWGMLSSSCPKIESIEAIQNLQFDSQFRICPIINKTTNPLQ